MVFWTDACRTSEDTLNSEHFQTKPYQRKEKTPYSGGFIDEFLPKKRGKQKLGSIPKQNPTENEESKNSGAYADEFPTEKTRIPKSLEYLWTESYLGNKRIQKLDSISGQITKTEHHAHINSMQRRCTASHPFFASSKGRNAPQHSGLFFIVLRPSRF